VKTFMLASLGILAAGCASHSAAATEVPDFEAALRRHLAAIERRDIDAFKSSVTTDDTLLTIAQNGHAFTTPEETIALHEDWFKRDDWSWKGEVVRTMVGADLAAAVIRYVYQDTPDAKPISTWLTFVFRLEDGEWRLVHDQNTLITEEAK